MESTNESIGGTLPADTVRHDEIVSDEKDGQPHEDVNDNCLLCNKPMEASQSIVVKERGVWSLIQASIKRKDRKNLQLQKLKEITVHKTCRCIYVRESSIKSALKARTEIFRSNRERCKDGRNFDYSTACFFCSELLNKSKMFARVLKQTTIDNIIENLQVYPETEINKTISSRLCCLRNKDDDYYVANSVFYHHKCYNRFYYYSPNNIKGRPISEDMSDLLCFIINYILENSDECQFSLKEILSKYIDIHGQTDLPQLSRIEPRIKQHFEDEIVIYTIKKDRIICFKQSLGHCLEDSWYKNRKSNKREEELRIVEMASHLVLQDIRTTKFDIPKRDSPADIPNNVQDIPESLKIFLDILIKTHKYTPENDSSDQWENRIITAAHILMSSVRPRSFYSPIALEQNLVQKDNIEVDEMNSPKKRKIL